MSVFTASLASAQYVDSKQCAGCHAKLYASYRLTGMGRSFSAGATAETVSDFYHKASDTHYSMSLRGGKYYQRRWQTGPDNSQINDEELRVDYVLGSGNHARTYLNRNARGILTELPLGWYSERGGYWAMNPGYDTAHPPSHRAIAYECMFCHNAYPSIPPGHEQPGAEPVYAGALPEGIDCQRCHGPGSSHVAAARSGRPLRGAIVNPAKLGKTAQMEVCMQCHLEPASTRLPGIIRRFDRGPFSYRPGEPLANFVLYFDHAPGSGYDDKFEIAGGAYRFRQSQCFLQSRGQMTCETCHDPHSVPRGAEAAGYYNGICGQCHAATVIRQTASGHHPAATDCVSCHMPKRRTDDTVHAVITDHRISRHPPARDLLADLAESHPAPGDEYQGKVVPYYPSPLPETAQNALYVALAQVRDGRNLTEGLVQLAGMLARVATPDPEFLMALGDAWHSTGDDVKAAAAYRRAVRMRPDNERYLRYLGIVSKDAQVLRSAVRLNAQDAQAWLELGLITADDRALEKARLLNPDLPDVWNAIGVNRQDESALRQALRIDPYYATASFNLARLLAGRADLVQALFYFDKAARLQPSNAVTLYEYALALVQMNRFDESHIQAEAAVRADPELAEAHELLGGLLAREKKADASLVEFEAAVRLKPEFSRAQLDLAATLAAAGNKADAIIHFREAAKSTDPQVAGAARGALRQLGSVP